MQFHKDYSYRRISLQNSLQNLLQNSQYQVFHIVKISIHYFLIISRRRKETTKMVREQLQKKLQETVVSIIIEESSRSPEEVKIKQMKVESKKKLSNNSVKINSNAEKIERTKKNGCNDFEQLILYLPRRRKAISDTFTHMICMASARVRYRIRMKNKNLQLMCVINLINKSR